MVFGRRKMKHPLLLVGVLSWLGGAAALAEPPPAPKRPVTDTHHGVAVTDPYRWLEDSGSKEVQEWSDAQNAYARGVLDRLPGRDALRKRLTQILSAPTTSHSELTYRAGRLFALRRQPPREQPFLVVMPGPDQPDKAR